MAIQWGIINASYASASDRMGRLLSELVPALVARGWTVRGSGDGVATFQNEGQTAGPYNVFTASPLYYVAPPTTNFNSPNPLNWSHARAWVRIREPSGGREIVIQRTNSNTTYQNLNIGIATAPLTSGASANTVPTGATLTDTNMTFAGGGVAFAESPQLAVNAGPAWTAHVGISDVATASGVWPFYVIVTDGSSNVIMTMLYDGQQDIAPGDDQPWVLTTYNNAHLIDTVVYSTTVTNSSRMAMGIAGGTITRGGWSSLASSQTSEFAKNGRQNSDSVYRAHRAGFMYLPSASHYLFKGRSANIYMNPTTRVYPDTMNLAGAAPYLIHSYWLIPWKTGVTPSP